MELVWLGIKRWLWWFRRERKDEFPGWIGMDEETLVGQDRVFVT